MIIIIPRLIPCYNFTLTNNLKEYTRGRISEEFQDNAHMKFVLNVQYILYKILEKIKN